MWPPETASWSYKNTYKIYGTLLFEHFYSTELGEDFLENVLSSHTADLETKLQLFIRYENRKFNHTQDQIVKLVEMFTPF
jgi:hypothetical protein